MTQIEQRLILATGLVLLIGSGLFVAMGGLSRTAPDPLPANPPEAVAPDSTAGHPLIAVGPSVPGMTDPAGDGVLRPGGSAALAGLREPTGDDLSDPTTVKRLLREYLAEPNIRWDYVAKLLQVYREPLESDVKAAFLAALEHGNAAGALQALAFLNDGSIVADLLRLMDNPSADPRNRGIIPQALSTIPGADAAEVVTGLESRLNGDLSHDLVLLQAIARTGGIEAVRALVEAIAKAKVPGDIGADVWRELDLKKSPEASDRLASDLRSTSLSPEALAVLVEMAGKPGASRALVESLLALDADATPEPVRRRVLGSLAATGDDAAVNRVLDVATKGADYASVAANVIGNITSASPSTRTRLLELATKTGDDNLRAHTYDALGVLRMSEAVPLLTQSLASPSPLVLLAAVKALGRVGKDSAPALDALAKVYDGGDEAMRQHVAIAVGQIGGDRAASLLNQFQLVEKSDKVKTTLAGAVRKLGPR